MGLYEDIIENKKKKDKEEKVLFKEITSGKFKQRPIPQKEETIVKKVKTKKQSDEDLMSPITKPVESSGYDELYTTMTPTTDTKLLKQNKEISDERYNKAKKILASKVKQSNLETKPYDQKATSYKELREDINNYTSGKNTVIQNIEKNKQKAKLAETSDVKSAKNKRAVSTSQYEVQKAKEDYKGPSAQELLMSPVRGAGALFKSAIRDDLIIDDDFDRKLPSYNDTTMSLNQSQDNEIYNTVYGFGSELGKQGAKKLLDKVSFNTLGNTFYYKSIYDQVYSSARDEGYSEEDAGKYAIASVGGEAALENLLGGSKYLTGGKKTIGDKAFSGLFKGLTKSKFVNDLVSSSFSEGGEEGLENQYELLMHQLILEKKFDPNAFISKSNIVDTIKSMIIGSAIGSTSTASQRVSNVISNPNAVKYEDAIYRIESETGEKVNDYNKNVVANLINELSTQGIKTSDKEIANLYNSIKNVQAESFENNAISQYSNLDDNSRVLYNNEIKDISNFIKSTGVNIRFDQNLTDLSEWKGNTLVINPSMTDTPIKTLLLKELGTNLLDEDTKAQLIDKLKQNGMYDNLKEYVQSQGIEENRVDNEIVSLEMNSIFENEEKLKEFAKTSKLDLQEIKSTVDELSQKLTPTTKDYVYIKSLQDRINKLNINENNLSGEQLVDAQLKNIKEIDKKSEGKEKAVSNDLGRFVADTTKYTGMGKKTLENASKSGIVGNNQEAKDFVNFLAKVSEDKGLEFNFIDNKTLKQNKKELKDSKGNKVSIDGYIDNGVITVNLDSKNALNVIVGHEITHALENSKYYKQLQKTVLDYLGKEKADAELKELARLYSNVKDANTNKELVANTLAKELFTNKQFINDLTKDRNMFQRIFDEVKYLWNELRGKNTEIDKMYHNFVKAYNDKIAKPSGFKYLLADITADYDKYKGGEADINSRFERTLEQSVEPDKATDNLGNKLTKDMYEWAKPSKVVNSKGQLELTYNMNWNFIPDKIRPSDRYSEDAMWYCDDYLMDMSYGPKAQIPYLDKITSFEQAKDIVKKYNKDWTLKKSNFRELLDKGLVPGGRFVKNRIEQYGEDGLDKAYERGLLTSEELKYAKNYIENKEVSVLDYYEYGELQEEIFNDENELFRKLPTMFENDPNHRSFISPTYLKMVNPYVVDSKGNYAAKAAETIVEQDKIDEALSITNSIEAMNDIENLKEESKNKYLASRRKREELWKYEEDANYHLISTDFFGNVEESYDARENSRRFIKMLVNPNLEYLTYESIYDYFKDRGIEAPKPTDNVKDILDISDHSNFRNFVDDKMTFDELYFELQYINMNASQFNSEYDYFINNLDDILKLNTMSKQEFLDVIRLSDINEENITKRFTKNEWTDEVVERILKSNREGKTNYDGIIFRNIWDYYMHEETEGLEGIPRDELPRGNIFVIFNQNQRKYASNQSPTSDLDARYMLSSEQEEQTGDYNVYGKDIKYNPLVKKPKEVKQETKQQVNKKVLNPNQIAQLKPEDANTTPELKTKKYNKTKTGESKQVETLGKSELFTDKQKQKIINDEEFTKYDKITNKQSLEEAFERLEKGGSEETLRWFNKKSTDADATDIAEGIILMKQYADNKQTESMVEVAKKLRDMKTKTAQALQASSIMSRMTPEGMVAYAQSELDEAYNKLVQNKTKDWIEQNRDKFNLTTNDVEFIMNTMNKVSQMEDGYEKKVELAKIQKIMTDKIPPEIGKSIKGWLRLSMLFNPKTQVRNVGGNALIAPVNVGGDIVASWADKIISKRTGVRTTGNVNAKSIIEGFKRGAYEATNDYKLGINTKNMEGNRFEIGEGKSFSEKTIIGKGLNRTEGLLNYMMDLGDRVFSEAWFENSLANQMKLNGVDKPTQEMIDIATNEALQRTWNDNNNYTKFVLDVRKMLNRIGGENYGLGDVLIPFAKTPANLTKAIVDYSPVGLVNSLIQYNKLNKAIGRGDFTSQQQHQFVQTLGKATAGTMLYVLGYALAKSGMITGKDDEDKDTKNFLKNVLGVNQYSIKIGDKSFTYDWAQPIAAPLSIMSNIVNKRKNKETALLEGIVGSLDSAGSILMEQSFLQSLNDVFTDNDGVVSGLINEILNLPSRAVPTFSKQIADLVDSTQRQTFEYDKPIKTAVNSIVNKVPFLSKTLAPKVNTMGEDILKYGGKNNIFNVMLNPANVGKENVSEAGKEIYRVYQETGNKNIMPRVAPYYTGTGENKKIMSSDEIAEFQKISGGIVESAVSDIMNTSEYKALSADEKASVLKNIVDYAYNYANNKVTGKEMSSTYNKANQYVNNGGKIGDYYLNQKEANYSMEYPERYKVIEHITTFDDYKKYDEEIKELRKHTSNDKYETTKYINNLDLGYDQRVLMFKLYYPKDHTYDTQIINYIDESVDNYDDKVEILNKLGFKISSDGTVRW